MAIPVIIDTDIGTDIDDTWALVMALRSPELDVRLITTSTGAPAYRAALVADLLAAAGRPDIPIGLGAAGGGRLEEPLAELADPRRLEAHPGGVMDGVAAIAETISFADQRVTIVGLGPLTTVATAVGRHPEIAGRARLVAMAGSVRVGYKGSPGPVPEYNVATDVGAARAVLGAGWPCLVTPLDTCGTVWLSGPRYSALRAHEGSDPLVDALLRHQQAWLNAVDRPDLSERRSTTLYDTVAVYLAYDEELVVIEELDLAIDDDGTMHAGAGGSVVRVATAWADQEGFLDHLLGRLTR
jgi:inosine-uridine nucleoside N-ribohydrolase